MYTKENKSYSKEPFEGYTHRYKVKLDLIDDPHPVCIDIYTDECDKENVAKVLAEQKKERVVSLKIVHSVTKEQDDADYEFINGLKSWLSINQNVNYGL